MSGPLRGKKQKRKGRRGGPEGRQTVRGARNLDAWGGGQVGANREEASEG